MSKDYEQYYIDISGVCNLSCPSCPVGNFKDSDRVGDVRSKKFMSFDLFKAIVDKIEKENSLNIPIVICLYNWGEPLLHPNISQMIRYIKEKGFFSDVSSNLNIRSIESILTYLPDKMIVSMSGYTQTIYEKSHRKGNIHLVLSNLYKLKSLLDKSNKKVIVEIFYHIYIDNMGEDFEKVNKLCNELGFNLFADVALFMPVEKSIACLEQQQLSTDESALIDKLLVRPNELFDMTKPYQQESCGQQNVISIRSDGSVSLCFPTYDRNYTIVDSFLATTKAKLLELKKTHSFCHTCKKYSLHAVVGFNMRQELNALIDQRLSLSGSQFRMNYLKKRLNPYLMEA